MPPPMPDTSAACIRESPRARRLRVDAGVMSRLAHSCVYTMRHSNDLARCARTGGTGSFTENKRRVDRINAHGRPHVLLAAE